MSSNTPIILDNYREKFYGVTDYLYKILKELIENEDEYLDFVKNYWEPADTSLSAIVKFRKDKIDKINLSYEEFIYLYNIDRKIALKKLYQDIVDNSILKSLDDHINNGDSFEDLYYIHVLEPYVRLGKTLTFGSLNKYLCRLREYEIRKNIKKVDMEETDETEFQKIICEGTFISTQEKPKKKVIDRVTANVQVSSRDPKIKYEAILKANYNCEYDTKHISFTSFVTGHNYVEAHHLIPLEHEGLFAYSIDVPGNIVSLCPNCHRLVHHAIDDQKKDILYKLYISKKNTLKKYGIDVSFENLLQMYGIR